MSENTPTMGNLFSGSGTWELVAKMCGIDVKFEAEIEPFPVLIEEKRFPEAVQLGDVSSISGADVPYVDILTNSSPCQDLSIAGNREGLDADRSGLFHEAIRITKEMREATNGEYPKFWCWENVPGAFSSNRGEDFRKVLESVAQLVEENAVIPLAPKGWSYAGVVDGDGWQIAWRTMDAQFYGVPQRRRRVFLVADFTGHRAGGVLFERESVSWNFKEIAETWQRTSDSLAERINTAGRIVRGEIRENESKQRTFESIKEPVVFNGETITSPQNKVNVKNGDPCHSLNNDSRNYLVKQKN